MVTSDNGILKETKKAKQQAEIDNEKSIVERAKMLAMMRSKNGAITYEIFEPALKDESGKISTDVSDAGDIIEVLFTNSNRYYEIDQDGNVSEPQEVQKDENAGDITKGGRCDGSEEKPYEINCIEDLVALSNIVNGTGIKLENGQAVEITMNDKFQGKNVILMRTLNFNSKYSYEDSNSTKFGDLNQDGIVENIKTELTKTEENCTGFTPIGNSFYDYKTFNGTFNGKNNEIKNLYVKAAGYAGVFGAVWGTIENLTVSGNITSTNGNAGGIVGKSVGNIYNCCNKATIQGYDYTGGIGGDVWANGGVVLLVMNCKNLGNVTSVNNRVGGIVGGSSGEVTNCYNAGKVTGNYNTGGIIGQSRQKVKLTNCYNVGNIESKLDRVAGIVANVYAEVTVNNCYNIGKLIGSSANGLGATTISNSYNFGQMTSKNPCNTIGAKTINSCYYKSSQKANNETTEEGVIDLEGKTAQQMVEILNSYKDSEGAYPIEWKKWKIGSDGYPTFAD